MGNTNSNSRHDNVIRMNDTEIDTLNWGNFNTDEISIKDDQYRSSHNIPKGLEYLDNLDIPQTSVAESDYHTANNISNNTFVASNLSDNNLGLPDKLTDLTESVSATSPFISSEMYKFVMKGGAEQDDSESSATSSSNDNEKMVVDKDKKGKNKDDDDDSSSNSSNADKNEKSEPESSEMAGGSSVTSASYISSSDHCGDDSENHLNTSSAVSTDDRVVSSSLNTSDINLISLKN